MKRNSVTERRIIAWSITGVLGFAVAAFTMHTLTVSEPVKVLVFGTILVVVAILSKKNKKREGSR